VREFKDKANNTWKVELNVGTVIRVKQESGGRFDLFNPASKPGGDCGERELCSVLYAEDLSDWGVIYEVLYYVVRPQLDGKYDSPLAFAEAMAGDCLVAAQRALLEEWRDFFHQLQRPDLAKMLELRINYHAKAVELVREKLQGPALQGLDARVEAAMHQTMNGKLGDLQASLDKILGPIPSASSAP
jgi:hypothetical protein